MPCSKRTVEGIKGMHPKIGRVGISAVVASILIVVILPLKRLLEQFLLAYPFIIAMLVKLAGLIGIGFDGLAQQSPYRLPGLLFLIAGSFVYKRWSASLLFFLFSRKDGSVMGPLPDGKDATDVGIPWVHPSIDAASQQAQSTASQRGKASAIKSWEDQACCFQALQQWLHWGSGDGRWGWLGLWPCRPTVKRNQEWLPLSVAILTGANGVGKSRLSFELGHQLARHSELGLRSSANEALEPWSRSKRLAKTLSWWVLRNLPCTCRAADDPWDVGLVDSNSLDVQPNFTAWRPRRPTLLIFDEPSENIVSMVRTLEINRKEYWHPVRLLLVDQSLPSALNAKNADDLWCDSSSSGGGAILDHAREQLKSWQQEKGGARKQNPVPFLFKGVFDLGEVRFSQATIRAIWSTATSAADRHVIGKLRQDLDFDQVRQATGGNPLLVVLAVQQLRNNTMSLQELHNLPQADAAQQLIQPRAQALYDHFSGILQDATNEAEKIFRAIATATVCGGLWYKADGLLKFADVERLFPDRGVFFDTNNVWIPPVRPKAIGTAFLQNFLDEKGAADVLATLAWEQNEPGCVQALRHPADLPPALYREVAAIAQQRLSPLAWAQTACAAVLFGLAPAAFVQEALQSLPGDALVCMGEWLDHQLCPPFIQPPEPVAVSIIVASLMAALQQADLLAEDNRLGWCLSRYTDWAAQIGAQALRQSKRHEEFAASREQLLLLISKRLFHLLTSDSHGQKGWTEEIAALEASQEWLLPQMCTALPVNPVRETIRFAQEMEKHWGNPALVSQVRLQRQRAQAWQYVTYAASDLGGIEGYTKSLAHAEQVERISTSDVVFLYDAGIQGQRGAAWQYVTYAASDLGGIEGYGKSLAHAEKVEEISTSDVAFLSHAEIQEQRATAWRHVAYAAGQLGGVEGYGKSLAHAEQVECIATSEPAFLSHAGIQEKRASAWGYAAYAAGQLGGTEGYGKSLAHAEQVEEISTSDVAFLSHAEIQEQRGTAWRHVAYAAGQLGGTEGYGKSLAHAEQVECISTSEPAFLSHAGIQEQRAVAWKYVASAACLLGGIEGYSKSLEHAEQVERIASSVAFFSHAWMQMVRAIAWGYVASAASQLGGGEGYNKCLEHAEQVERIATSELAFLGHAGVQLQRAIAWENVASAASQLGGVEGFGKCLKHAEQVECIAISELSFLTHAGIQEARAATWGNVAYAACQLGGTIGYGKSLEHAEQVECIATSELSFLSHTRIQGQRAIVWGYVAAAAGQLGGVEGYGKSLEHAEQVERIATSDLTFLGHAGIQEQRATAWRHVAYAASELGGFEGYTKSLAHAEQVERIATSELAFLGHAGIQGQRARAWQYVAAAAVGLHGNQGPAEVRRLARRVLAIVDARQEFASNPFLQEQRAKALVLLEDHPESRQPEASAPLDWGELGTGS